MEYFVKVIEYLLAKMQHSKILGQKQEPLKAKEEVASSWERSNCLEVSRVLKKYWLVIQA